MYPPTLFHPVVLFFVLLLIVVSQSYWFVRLWQFAGRRRHASVRIALRLLTVVLFGLLVPGFFLNFSFTSPRITISQSRGLAALGGLWFSSAFFAFLFVQFVNAVAALWRLAFGRRAPDRAARSDAPDRTAAVDLPRRRFVHAATVVAGATPFLVAGYGFAIERFRYQVREIELPVHNLPPALDGLRIAQLSDIHIGSYMSAAGVRRAVDMANELHADLTVVTGDFLTRVNDPLAECIAELSRLEAPLGVWGCNGNHEIYAGVEALAAKLFRRHGMELLRQECVELVWHAQPFNLIGVDYQRDRDNRGRSLLALASIESMVRRDVPNILLSHNPNSFRRAAELGIELMLTGHTHGGQVNIEILDYRFSPAQFFTPYVAGLFRRPLGASWLLDDRQAWAAAPTQPASVVYVNRGLGTIAVPVRLGVPPEISLHTLRRA